MGRGKGYVAVCTVLFMLVHTLEGAFLQSLKAAEGQYGIWCVDCGKWQDHYEGNIDSGTLVRTKYKDGRVSYGEGGTVYICCESCHGKLVKLEWKEDVEVFDAGTENETERWTKDYTVEMCRYVSGMDEADIIFPQLATYLQGFTSSGESYRVISDGDIFTNISQFTTEEVYKEATRYFINLFDGMARCLSVEQVSGAEGTLESVCSVSGGSFTWMEWYDCGYLVSSSGSAGSGLLDYMAKFGREAIRQMGFCVSFIPNGGEGSMEPVTIYSGGGVLPANTMVRDGYRFVGWACSPDGEVVYRDEGDIDISLDTKLYACWEKEDVPPKISIVEKEAEIKVYRDGVQTEDAVRAGDRVELIPVKKQGREPAGYHIFDAATDAVWEEENGRLVFTMPEADVWVEFFYRELRGLEVSPNSLFVETYHKPPYWHDGSFNLDCGQTVTVEKDMLDVYAVFYHTGTGETERRKLSDFSVTGDNRVVNMGENVLCVEADVLQDGYSLSAQYVLRADSPSLKDLMDQTESGDYKELKEFVDRLTGFVEEFEEQLAGQEETIERLQGELEVSGEEKEELVAALKESSGEIALLKDRLAGSEEQLATMGEEAEALRESLDKVQALIGEITGAEQITPSAVEELVTQFEELKTEKDQLADKLSEAEQEKIELTDKVSGLESEKGELTDRVSGLESESGSLAARYEALYAERGELLRERDSLLQAKRSLEGERDSLLSQKNFLINSNTELSEQLKHTIEEQQIILGEYELLKKNYTLLSEEYQRKEQEYKEKIAGIDKSLGDVKKEKDILTEQILSMEEERQRLKDEWRREKEALSASVQKLQAEAVKKGEEPPASQGIVPSVGKEEPKHEGESESATQATEAEEPETTEGTEGQTETDSAGGTEGQTGPETGAGFEEWMEAETAAGFEEWMRPGEDTELEGQTEAESEEGSEEQTEAESYAEPETAVEPEETAVPGTEGDADLDSYWTFPEPDQIDTIENGLLFGRIVHVALRIIPGIIIVVVAMALGGLILYILLDQKEKRQTDGN